MWNSDLGFIRKFVGHHNAGYFNQLADKVYRRGVLTVFCLKEGCADCEKLMIMIENFKQGLIRRPENMIVAWGVKRFQDKPTVKGEKIKLAESTQLPSQDFVWEPITGHGFGIAESSVNYLIFEEDHNPRVFARYIKNIYRRMQFGLMTTNRVDINQVIASKGTNSILIQYPTEFDVKELQKMEAYFAQIFRKYTFVPYFIESPQEAIKVYNKGELTLETDNLDIKRFLPMFKKNL